MIKIKKNKRKEIIITNIIENDKINITVKNDTKLLRTMIGRNIENQIEIVNDKMNKNIKGINNKKLIRTIIGIFN